MKHYFITTDGYSYSHFMPIQKAISSGVAIDLFKNCVVGSTRHIAIDICCEIIKFVGKMPPVPPRHSTAYVTTEGRV